MMWIPEARYLHWEFVDPDSIPVCGFEWIHWSVANLPIDALMYDFNDSHALAIPPDFSRQLPAMIPETVQGRNSSASKFLGRSTDPAVMRMRYDGPQPPDKDHVVPPAGVGHQEAVARLEIQGSWLDGLVARAAQQRCGARHRRHLPDRQGVSHMSPRRRGLSASLTGGGAVQNHLQSDFVVELPPVGACLATTKKGHHHTMACTTILVGEDASYDGSTVVARNEESANGEFNPKRFIVVKPEEQPREYKSVISHLTITLPDDPLQYTAVPNADLKEGIWGEAEQSTRRTWR